jgi:hypothetical protein
MNSTSKAPIVSHPAGGFTRAYRVEGTSIRIYGGAYDRDQIRERLARGRRTRRDLPCCPPIQTGARGVGPL